jgi:hypothetical protein
MDIKELKDFVIQTVTKERPESTQQLRDILLRRYDLSPDAITRLLVELENEDKIHYRKPEAVLAENMVDYVVKAGAVVLGDHRVFRCHSGVGFLSLKALTNSFFCAQY